MSCPFGVEELVKLKQFISFCSVQPEVLNIPQLEFFKSFIEQLGGTIPAKKEPQEHPQKKSDDAAEDKPEPEEDESEPESDVELDMIGVIEGDNDEPQPMGDVDKVPTEEEIEKSGEIRIKASECYSNQQYDEAVQHYTEAIQLNPTNALFMAKRGQSFLKLKKPNACIRDCNRALELNCDSAAAYKFRGRAHRLLGNWELAAKDLRQACKLDFDEETDEWLKEVAPNAKKIEQHKIKQERKRVEKELQKRQERVRQAQDANKKAHEENQKSQEEQSAGPRAGGMPNLGNIFGNLNQAEILSAFSDPEVSAAMQDIMSNPANIAKYQSNPKIMNLITKIGSAMGGSAGGGFPGAGSFAGAAGDRTGAESTPKAPQPDFSDDGLD